MSLFHYSGCIEDIFPRRRNQAKTKENTDQEETLKQPGFCNILSNMAEGLGEALYYAAQQSIIRQHVLVPEGTCIRACTDVELLTQVAFFPDF